MVPMTNSPTHVVCWALLLLADTKSSEISPVQERVQKELDAAFGAPSEALDPIRTIRNKCNERSSLAFSMATFWEVFTRTINNTVYSAFSQLHSYLFSLPPNHFCKQVMRFGTVIVMNFARQVTEVKAREDEAGELAPRRREKVLPVKFRDWIVPKGSYLTINFWAINRDQEIWEEKTNEFWPEHFYEVGADGTPRVNEEKVKKLVAFSLGTLFTNRTAHRR